MASLLSPASVSRLEVLLAADVLVPGSGPVVVDLDGHGVSLRLDDIDIIVSSGGVSAVVFTSWSDGRELVRLGDLPAGALEVSVAADLAFVLAVAAAVAVILPTLL